MITAIREVRRAKGLTLADVAERCDPPTTAQTIGRLETGTRTVSVDWLNRIAAALGVEGSDLVRLPEQNDVPVAAVIEADGIHEPRHALTITPPRPHDGTVCIQVDAGMGDYRAGDEIWCDKVEPADYGTMLNRDVLLPRPGGRFIFGRLIGRSGTQLQVLPPNAGSKQQVIVDPPWAAMAARLIRNF
jgi:transcriptional regulator with XRE-family HTH domain